MKKTIEFKLDLKDPFFTGLQKQILNLDGISSTDHLQYALSIISPVMNATLKTLKNLCSTQIENPNKLSKFSYEYKENIYPDFHNLLEENIDISLNRRIHTATLERITDIIEKFISDYADEQKQQNMLKVEPVVDADKELIAITNYISSTWKGFSDETSSELFKTIWDSCNNKLRNHFDQYAFLDLIEKMYESRDSLNIKINDVNSKHIATYFMISNSKLQDILKNEWDYEENVNSIITDVKTKFPYASKARPLGWTKMAKNYTDYEGMTELDSKELKKLFGGMDSGTAGSYSFEIRTSLPHVMYDDKCQGRKPLEVLIGAMVGHAYVMNEQNNASKMLQEWIDLTQKIENNPNKDINFDFQQPLNQALFHMIKNNAEVTPGALKILGINNNNNNNNNNKRKMKR